MSLLASAAQSAATQGAFGPVDQRYLFEARQLQALSFAVHIPLVCFGVAFPALVVFAEWRGQRRGDRVLLALARRWSRVMITLFAVGVVTGTILSFELGMLWPNFMATFGDVFGLAFALEGFSFFTEAIFLGIYVYGWDRLSPRMHLLAGVPVVISGFTGSLMVITVNAWMNHPTGFTLRHGRAVDVHPFQALFGNDYMWHELVHMYVAGYVVTGFVCAAVYSWAWLHGRRDRYVRAALSITLACAAVAAPVELLVGDWAGRAVAGSQPVKLAAFEGVPHTERGAPIHVLGWYDGSGVEYGLRVPRLLSLLADHDPGGRITGLDTVPADRRPPVNVVRFAFQTMVGIGTLLVLLGVAYLFVRVRERRLPRTRWFYWLIVAAGPLSLVALLAGWVTTEVGRQPWVVYGVMLTADAVTGASGIPVGYATVAGVYAVLAAGTLWALRRIARSPLALAGDEAATAPGGAHVPG
jgi:cytochrome d ubiquinol oxidase subunit I